MDSRDGVSEQLDWYTGADWSLDWAQDKDLKKIPDTPDTSSILDGCQRDRVRPGPPLNTTSQWESVAPLSMLPVEFKALGGRVRDVIRQSLQSTYGARVRGHVELP